MSPRAAFTSLIVSIALSTLTSQTDDARPFGGEQYGGGAPHASATARDDADLS